MIGVCLRVCALLSLFCALAHAERLTRGDSEACRHNLTKFDPYLSKYIGKR